MTFTTPISIPQAPFTISHRDRILLLGSCFSDEVGAKLREYYFWATSNPSGTLYNPISIANAIHRDEPVISAFAEADVVFITLGTAWVYERDGEVVANCQKLPASLFTRRRLTVEEIVATWRPILEANPDKRFVFTVSPIRHRKDGLHENQLSKAILLLAIEALGVNYFPSYEILLDELRDYRYYGADMLHPSPVAVSYIFERFAETYCSAETHTAMTELHALYLDEHHRLLHPETEESQAFLARTRALHDSLMTKYGL